MFFLIPLLLIASSIFAMEKTIEVSQLARAHKVVLTDTKGNVFFIDKSLIKESGYLQKKFEEQNQSPTIWTELSPEELKLLLLILESQSFNNLLALISLKKIKLPNSRAAFYKQLQKFELPNTILKQFDKVLILKGIDTNNSSWELPVRKDIVTTYFDLISTLVKNEPDTFKIEFTRLRFSKFITFMLYDLAKKVSSTGEPTLIVEWDNVVWNFLQNKPLSGFYKQKLHLNDTQINNLLFNMLLTGEFLGAKSYILEIVYKNYIQRIPEYETFSQAETLNRIKDWIDYDKITTYGKSIDYFLNRGIPPTSEIDENTKTFIVRIIPNEIPDVVGGMNINSLQGLENIPHIGECIYLRIFTSMKTIDFDFSKLPNLKGLGLDNKLIELSAGWASGLKKLSGLILADNQLKELKKGDFEGLSSLKLLDISNNPLEKLNLNGIKV